jgi:hypothetical protein
MVKPALPYLDVLADAAQLAPDHPLACYQVSGEFAMVVAGARAGVYDLRTAAFETVDGMIRAGTSVSLSLFVIVTNNSWHRGDINLDVLHTRFLGLARSMSLINFSHKMLHELCHALRALSLLCNQLQTIATWSR